MYTRLDETTEVSSVPFSKMETSLKGRVYSQGVKEQ